MFYLGHVNMAINIRSTLRVAGTLGGWETGSFRIKSKFLGHYKLIDNSNPSVLQGDTKISYLQIFQ